MPPYGCIQRSQVLSMAPSITSAKLLLLLLIYPRLISFEIDRGRGSARQGWRKERCQPRMAVCAAPFSGHSQNAAGTLGMISRRKTFCFVFGLFKNEGPRQGYPTCPKHGDIIPNMPQASTKSNNHKKTFTPFLVFKNEAPDRDTPLARHTARQSRFSCQPIELQPQGW